MVFGDPGIDFRPLFNWRDFVSCRVVDLVRLSLVLEVAAHLDRGLATASANVECVLRAPILSLEVARETTMLCQQLLRTIAISRADLGILRDRALCSACLSSSVELRENSLRARTNVVLVQLAKLSEIQLEPSDAGALFVGKLSGLRDVAELLHAGIGRANARWRCALRAIAEQPELANGERERERMYHIALDQAELAFDLIGRDHDLLTFLRVGAASRNEPLRISCREIAAMVSADLSPDKSEGCGVCGISAASSGGRRPA